MSMTLQASDLALYAIALLILFLTPGPVWVALLARAIAGGFQAAWPLALGGALGDAIWPTLAILGVSWVVSEIDGIMSYSALRGRYGIFSYGSVIKSKSIKRFGQ